MRTKLPAFEVVKRHDEYLEVLPEDSLDGVSEEQWINDVEQVVQDCTQQLYMKLKSVDLPTTTSVTSDSGVSVSSQTPEI